jgi:TPR repeat protein
MSVGAQVNGEIVALAPDDHATHFDFAAALATFWRYEEALEPLAVALRLDPDHGPTLRLAAILYEANRRHDDAFAVIRRGAERGDRLQMFALSAKYCRGLGTPVDPEAAFRWLNQAAEHGHITAMRMLRDILREGREGIPLDDAKAAYWDERLRREGLHPER